MVYPEVLDSVLVMLLAQLFNKQRLPKNIEDAQSTEAGSQHLHPKQPAEFFIFNSASYVLLKVFEELQNVELFSSVLIDKQK